MAELHPYLQSLLGGLLIGASVAGLLLVNGRVAGISGILADAAAFRPGLWRWTFLAGLIGAGAIAGRLGQPAAGGLEGEGLLVLALAGLLVGAGTRLGSGCTSGHGVCGLANLSPRSLVATGVFMVSAGAVVFVVRHVLPALQFPGWGTPL